MSLHATCRTWRNGWTGNIMTAKLDGEIDHHTAKQVREQIDAAIDADAPAVLILDFRDITFMDSSGIGLIMGRYRAMKLVGGEVRIINPSPNIKRVLKLAGMDRLVRIETRNIKEEVM